MLVIWYHTISWVWATPDVDGMIQIAGTKEIPAFWIDRYEYPNQEGVVPTAGLSFETATALCVSQQKRLCTAAEWRHACRGTEQRRFPYGDTHQRGFCHQSVARSSSHTALMTADVVASGSYKDCSTSDGIMDLVGNLEEWVLDDWRGQPGMLEGGAAYTHDQYADCSGRYSRMPDYRLNSNQEIFSAGVRCCWSEVPLSEKLIGLDAKNRLHQSNLGVEYNAVDEVQLPSGGWMDRYEYPNQKGLRPETGVTWFEATQRCEAVGKRLCGVYEWEQACMSGDGRAFSTGEHYLKGGCAVERLTPSVSGEHAGCVNAWEIADMSGSVWEWTATEFEAPFLQVGYPQEMQDMAEIRGGSWMGEPSKAICRPDNGYPVTSKNMGYQDVGFRCCRGSEWHPPQESWGAIVECPQGMAAIGGFCIDQYEHPNRIGVYPTRDVAWTDAQQLCAEAGKRLCTEAEWDIACEGPSIQGYPYGDIYQSTVCGSKDRPGAELEKIGSHPACVTADGVFDLTGSVWEWTLAQDQQSGVLRGGGAVLSSGLGRCRSRAMVFEAERMDIGLRCCLTPR